MRAFGTAMGAMGLGCCVVLVGLASAVAEQSYLYPPEVSARPVVAVPDPSLQRHYWDPRYFEVYRAVPARCRCLPGPTSRQ